MPIKSAASPQHYIGRFAPSPSGPLHFGSLVAALASFLQARHQHGKWMVRIEDIDPPREIAGAAELILNSLAAHGLHWDGEVSKQSEHSKDYETCLNRLTQARLTYRCDCTRKKIKQMGGRYNGFCRYRALSTSPNTAIRFFNSRPISQLEDGLLGSVVCNPDMAGEDFVVKRRDGLYAYHLAVVVDDIKQNISEIVRGADLLETSGCHLALYQALDTPAPSYIHVPVACAHPGKKLSKQNHAPALEDDKAAKNLYQALAFLGQMPPASLEKSSVEQILDWSIAHWQLSKIPKKREIVLTPFS